MVNLLSPARFLATHSYTPAWCTVTISMMKECIPFSQTNILWKSSGRMALPSRYQEMSGVGRPPTWIEKGLLFIMFDLPWHDNSTIVISGSSGPHRYHYHFLKCEPWSQGRKCMSHLEVNPTEASFLYSEV